jgi:predicted deacylase
MLNGTPQPQAMTHHLFGDGDLDHVIEAQVAGYFRAEVELLSTVKTGQRIGVVQDLFGHPLQEVTAGQAGLVIMLRRFHRVHVGDGLAHITSLMFS